MARAKKKNNVNSVQEDKLYAYVGELETKVVGQVATITELETEVQRLKRSNAAFRATATRWKNRLNVM